MHASHYDCQQQQQQSKISHSLTRIAFSIIYVFMLNKKPHSKHQENCTGELKRDRKMRKNTENQHNQSACDKWVCGRVFIVETCLRSNEFFSVYIFPSSPPSHTHTHSIWKQINGKSVKLYWSIRCRFKPPFASKASFRWSACFAVDLISHCYALTGNALWSNWNKWFAARRINDSTKSRKINPLENILLLWQKLTKLVIIQQIPTQLAQLLFVRMAFGIICAEVMRIFKSFSMD